MRHEYKVLGTYLKEKRERSGLTQMDVAKAMGYGNAQFVSNWERGLASPPPKSLRKLVSVLRLPEKELLKVLLKEQEIFWARQLFASSSRRHVRIRA